MMPAVHFWRSGALALSWPSEGHIDCHESGACGSDGHQVQCLSYRGRFGGVEEEAGAERSPITSRSGTLMTLA
jgi:hypothetical protein